MDNKIAVDIALLPPQATTEEIIALTSHLPDASTRLNAQDCLPHITLAMGLLSKDKLSLVVAALKNLTVDIGKMSISIKSARSYQWKGSTLEPFSELVVDLSPELTNLQAEVMRLCMPHLTYDNVQVNHFFSPPPVDEHSIYWVEHYREHHESRDSFRPHITLGEGVIEKLERPITYSGSHLVVCHLGTYCTCRKVLVKI